MLQSGRPRHEQISDWLRDQIEEGVYTPNDQLPSESELGEKFEVSRITVRSALQTLENENRIYRRQGLGSFVSESEPRHGLVGLTDFAQDMAQAGLQAASEEVLHEQVKASPHVAAKLQVGAGQRVVRLDRKRLGDGMPVAFDRTWLPMFYGQLLEGHDLTEDTIYGILENEYEIPVLRGRYVIDATNANAALAAHLSVPEGHALLLIDRLSMTKGDRHLYFQRRYYRTDRIRYELELERDAEGYAPAEKGHALRRFDPVFQT